jgi:hypothetical protein
MTCSLSALAKCLTPKGFAISCRRQPIACSAVGVSSTPQKVWSKLLQPSCFCPGVAGGVGRLEGGTVSILPPCNANISNQDSSKSVRDFDALQLLSRKQTLFYSNLSRERLNVRHVKGYTTFFGFAGPNFLSSRYLAQMPTDCSVWAALECTPELLEAVFGFQKFATRFIASHACNILTGGPSHKLPLCDCQYPSRL